MERWRFEKGLQEIGPGSYAYLQPDGSWGWSNAGLVTDGEASLLVDTLFDLALTDEMLGAMREASKAAASIDRVVNTHANGDHCYGNQRVASAEIIASKAGAEDMEEVPPAAMAALLDNADDLGAAGEFLARIFSPFEFRGIEHVPPTRTFEGELDIEVGDKAVQLIEVGPAHTRGDVLVHVPSDRVVFTGDILFIEGTPIMWEGPVGNWIAACERICKMDVDAIVPGHGPITDRRGVETMRDYLVYIRDEARTRFDAGLSSADAARDIALGRYASWLDAERIAVNVDTLYREFTGTSEKTGIIELFSLMGELAKR